MSEMWKSGEKGRILDGMSWVYEFIFLTSDRKPEVLVLDKRVEHEI
jgi:hypothetical protein